MRFTRHKKPVAALAFCISLGCAVMATATAQTREDVRSKLDVQTKELESTRDRQRALESDVAAIDKERERINARLLETADLIQKSEARLNEIEARLGELGEQERVVRGSLNERQDNIAQLLAVLQRMGRNPPPVMITKREDALEMVRSAMLLSAAFPGLRSQATELVGRLEELVRVTNEVRTERERLKSETQELNDARTRLSGLMAEKKASLAERQAELAKVRSATIEISKSVDNLRALIASADRAASQVNAKIDEHNAKLEAAAHQAAAESANREASAVLEPVSGDGGASDDQMEVAVLAPSAAGFGKASTGRIEPAIPFHLAKAKLPRPTSGRNILSFGQQTEYGGPSKGMVFETRFSAQITSPCDGWIVYAGEFRSYGQLLIINAGGGYHVLLAGLSRIDVEPGQFVLAAEPVGTMGEAPRVQRGAEGAKPVLYVEFRKDGRPIDPDPWWVKDPEKVQG